MYKKIIRILSKRRQRSVLKRRYRYSTDWERLIEESLRERHVPLQNAWEQYQVLLAMYKIEEGIEPENPNSTDEPGPY